MQHHSVDRKPVDRKPASAGEPLAELTPRPDPPAERDTHRVILNVFGKRYELRFHTEVRVLPKDPAKVIEMPARERDGTT